MKIRIAALGMVMASALALSQALSPASAQAPATSSSLGKLEVKAYQKIPKTKIAVQLTSESELGRHLRGKVMDRLVKHGNEVGFSGGNVMRMDVLYLDLTGGGSDNYATMGGQPGFGPQGSNPRPELPANRIVRRDRIDPKSAPTLRLSLTLYAVDTGKVLWAASSACAIYSDVKQVGEAMIDTMFAAPDKDHVGDAGCPL
jgi:hypothetical protein